jgi:hypothetical protein
MKTTRYTTYLLFGIGLLLALVATTNYIIDPANIYGSTDEVDNSPNAYATRLIQSEHGLLWPNDSWSEREIKQNLASRITNADCAIIGSSRVMQISSRLEEPCFSELSSSIVNLGVSGGSLEDYMALSWELLQNSKRPSKIIFGIDPWALNWRQDSRWATYKESYNSMRMLLTENAGDTSETSSTTFNALQNLINLEYFQRSLSMIGVETHTITEAPEFDPEFGIQHPVFRPDGSLVYSETIIKRAADPERKIEAGDYKIIEHGTVISSVASQLFKQLVLHLKSEGIEVHFMLIPYHHSAWANQNSRVVAVMQEVETAVIGLADELDIAAWGSYNPKIVECDSSGFYDYMHPKASSLIHIKRRN